MNEKIIEYADSLYPEGLKQLENPPSRLYVSGNVEILNNLGIAVVGSRTNTNYGKRMCERFTKKLVEYDLNIISGLAIGIDSIAHKTCLEYAGKTIAVLPCGLNNIYPKQNIELLKKIIENGGLVITEYEDDVQVSSENFLERNRIIAGLGIGTLVVEAGYRSGTSVTARYTRDLNKPVFCIPSSLENYKGVTTNELIKKGGKLVTNIDDILDTYPNINFEKMKINDEKANFNISSELLVVYNTLKKETQDIDEIVRKCRLPAQDVSYKLLVLELQGYVEELPGKRYRLKEIGDD